MSFTITSALAWWVRECPDRVAISVEDQDLSYKELYEWSARVARYLLDQGVMAGDRVAVISMNSMEYAVLEIAIVRIGAIVAPLSFRSAVPELRESFVNLTPALIFADEDRMPLVCDALRNGERPGIRALSTIRALSASGATTEPVHDHEPDPDDPVFIIGTSGSTGRPKGVVESHRSVVTYAAEFVLMEPRCGSGANVLLVGPFSSSSGTLLLMQFLVAGNSLYIERQFKPARALELLVKHRITMFLAASVFHERIAALEEFATADLSGLYFSQTGGARISTDLLSAWRAKGVVLRQAYGCTEAGGAWAARDDVAVSAPHKCGRGGMFTNYAIRTSDGKFAAPGESGEILIRSPCLSPGYWNDPSATAAAFENGWLHTGDIGVLDETGNLTFIDRSKDIIISGGLNISSIEIENVISQIDGVHEVAVIAAAHPDFGETPLAIVHADTARVTSDLIIERCLERLARYKVPRFVVLEPDPLPRLVSGKISKVALRDRYRDAVQTLTEAR